jgi:site-specific recombinase XerD
MAHKNDPRTEINWDYFPLVALDAQMRVWLTIQWQLGLAPNTIYAYGHALEDFLKFCVRDHVDPLSATRSQIAAYVYDMTTRPNARQAKVAGRPFGLANNTLQQRLTALRLFYDYLIEEGHRELNPVGRGQFTPGKAFAGRRERGMIPRYHKLPWIPNDEQWQAILHAVREEPLRNRVMFTMAYDAGLRREELCSLETSDVDPSHRLLTIRAENTKNHLGRVVPYSEVSSVLYAGYLAERRNLSRARGPLFVSMSRRNRGQPVSIWTWSKVIEGVADRSGVHEFSTHTLRHLCLTDLARADWDVHEIATFAGHRSIQSTLIYIHLSGRELAEKLAASSNSIHARRVITLVEALHE